MMEKLKMQTPNLVDKNVEQIAKIFPEVITEIKDKDGNQIKGIDFDLLKQKLSNVLVEDENERYRLDWPGKKASLLKANTPITKTLRPVIEESVNFGKTENLYIEGDNFEVLKILQESYLGTVKMICIDPPYNTGKDFIYKDDFKKSADEYEEELGITNEEGGKLFKNTDTNGRFHSDWLSMMYERLAIARDLLKDDGIVFISIDDNEVHNLSRICDEIFGEDNFVAQITRATGTPTGGGGAKPIVNELDYLLIYSKSESVFFSGTNMTEKEASIYDKEDEWGRYLIRPLRRTGGEDRREDRPTMFYSLISPDGTEVFPKAPAGYESRWICGKDKYEELKKINLIEWKKTENNEWIVYQKFYLEGRLKQPGNLWNDVEGNKKATRDVRELFEGKKVFDFPKPVGFIKKTLQISTSSNDVILDFFSGSATTAHAVMQINAEDSGNRKFIMVQLPENTEEESETYKAGYKTISEIGKERIRRAGKKIKEEYLEKYEKELAKIDKELEQDSLEGKEELKEQKAELETKIEHVKNLDTGFRVYKTDTSNMKDVFYHPKELTQQQLSAFESNIKEDRTPEDLLTQVILDLGLELSLSIEKKEMLGNNVFVVQENALVACFDDNIDFGIVDKIAELKPLKVVFKDASFKDDKDRINVEERFKRLSPETIISVI